MGFVKIPYASDRTSYGFVPVPLAVVGGGDGPTVLLLAGVAGDEIAAQIAVAHIIQSLDPKLMNGRVIAMTMANLPAAQAGTRNSPLDGKSLNKSFPGDLLGPPTSVIADYIERQLMPAADLVIELHSEGRTMRYLSSATIIDDTDQNVHLRRLALSHALGIENILRFRSFDYRSTSGASRRAGATRIGVEVSGEDSVERIVAGVNRVFAWAGIAGAATTPTRIRVLLLHRSQDYVFALSDGVFHPSAKLGDSVSVGDLAGHVLDLTRPLAEPVRVVFSVDGIVVGIRGTSQVQRGDCVTLLAIEGEEAAQAELSEAATLHWFEQ